MPFNKDKTVRLTDFLERVYKRLESQGLTEAANFFRWFGMRDLARKLVEETRANPHTIDQELAPGDFDDIYPFVAGRLHEAASIEYSETHPYAYEIAHAGSEAFCAELNEFFETSGEDGVYDLIPIRSYVETAASSRVD